MSSTDVMDVVTMKEVGLAEKPVGVADKKVGDLSRYCKNIKYPEKNSWLMS